MAGEFDVALSAGKGATAGAATGASVGSAIPGVGTAIGAGTGALLGGVASGVKANKAAKADNAIQAQDPQELARLAEINRIRDSIGAGTDPLTQQKLQEAQQIGASTQANIARVTGGNVGATVVGMNRAQRGTQAASNQAIASAQERLPFFENMSQNLSTRISQRSLEVGLQKRDQAMAEKAQQGKTNSANIAGALGMLANKQGIPSAGGTGGGSGSSLSQPNSLAPVQKSIPFVDDPSLDPLNQEFIQDDDEAPIIEQLAPVVPGAPVGGVDPNGMSVGGEGINSNPFANPNNDPMFAASLPGQNKAAFVGNLLKGQIDSREAKEAALRAEKVRIAEQEARANGIYPDEHTGS